MGGCLAEEIPGYAITFICHLVGQCPGPCLERTNDRTSGAAYASLSIDDSQAWLVESSYRSSGATFLNATNEMCSIREPQ